jgi:hypothetical protein
VRALASVALLALGCGERCGPQPDRCVAEDCTTIYVPMSIGDTNLLVPSTVCSCTQYEPTEPIPCGGKAGR